MDMRETFGNMSFSSGKENCDLATKWLDEHDFKNYPNSAKIMDEASSNWNKINKYARAMLLNGVADAIDENSALICQMEMLRRNIYIKHTKNRTIPTLIDCFRYYAGWACMIDSQQDRTYIQLGENFSLSVLGMEVASAIAMGQSVIMSIRSINDNIIARLFIEILTKAGLPKYMLTVFPKDFYSINLNIFKFCTYIGDRFEETISSDNFKFTLYMGNTSAIVFEDSDFVSACDSIIEAKWSKDNTFLGALSRVFVQESVLTDFIAKLKVRLSKLRVGSSACDLNTDVLPTSITQDQSEHTLDINGFHFVIGAATNHPVPSYALHILLFRTTTEAIALANNSQFGLGISVWTENINLANEVALNLQAGLIWINCYGLMSANSAFSPYKRSGKGHFGGQQGLNKYKWTVCSDVMPKEICNFKYFFGNSFKGNDYTISSEDVDEFVQIAKKAQKQWWKSMNRVKILRTIANSSKSIDTQEAKDWITSIYKWTTMSKSSDSSNISASQIIVREPVGVVCFSAKDYSFPLLIELLAAALSYGNSVIVHLESRESNFFVELCKIVVSLKVLPGLINVCFVDEDKNTVHNHPEVCVLEPLFNEMEPLLVTKSKCIWTSTGESFI